MHELSSDFLRCVRCGGRLELEALVSGAEVIEGFLHCRQCSHLYPILSTVPVMWESTASYFAGRAKLGGELYLKSVHGRMQSYIKSCLSGLAPAVEDLSMQEKRWADIYRGSTRSKFYGAVRRELDRLQYENCLEHGSSIGTVLESAARSAEISFGVDRSFYAVREAKRLRRRGLDFFVADSLKHPFGERKFDLVLALNMLDIVEPTQLLSVAARQAGDLLLVSDPYDFERAGRTVKRAVDAERLRSIVRGLGFSLICGTERPCYIPWTLTINARTRLHYRVDMVVAERKGHDPAADARAAGPGL